ncbi:UPF0061 protein Hsero_2247 [Striga asiatica]|uniref:UPF0061 protein Hsero_2247 n=1 Tax=Striga asiatica TaxID=4170 RepID=A0A5A7Q1Q3_STRAF|nr:UPF0061 protein Hsero_2247 [Striga asiatica]
MKRKRIKGMFRSRIRSKESHDPSRRMCHRRENPTSTASNPAAEVANKVFGSEAFRFPFDPAPSLDKKPIKKDPSFVSSIPLWGGCKIGPYPMSDTPFMVMIPESG